MNRFWKISLTVIGGLAGMGLASVVMGSVFGGYVSAGQILRQKAYGLTERTADIRPFYEDMEIARFDEVAEVCIEAAQCEVTVVRTQEDFYGIAAKNMETLRCDREGAVLRVEADGAVFGGESSMTLYIPAYAQPDEMEITIGGGALYGEELSADAFFLEAGAGVFSIRDLRADSVVLTVGSGAMEIADGDVTDLVIETGMGEFSWQGRVRGDVQAECGMGAVTMAIEGAEKDFNYKTEGAMGDIIIEGMDAPDILFDHWLDNSADQTMNLACGMGTVTITFYENGGNENGK